MLEEFLAGACADPPRLIRAAADDLLARLARLGPDVRAARRLIAVGPAPDEGD